MLFNQFRFRMHVHWIYCAHNRALSHWNRGAGFLRTDSKKKHRRRRLLHSCYKLHRQHTCMRKQQIRSNAIIATHVPLAEIELHKNNVRKKKIVILLVCNVISIKCKRMFHLGCKFSLQHTIYATPNIHTRANLLWNICINLNGSEAI